VGGGDSNHYTRLLEPLPSELCSVVVLDPRTFALVLLGVIAGATPIFRASRCGAVAVAALYYPARIRRSWREGGGTCERRLARREGSLHGRRNALCAFRGRRADDRARLRRVRWWFAERPWWGCKPASGGSSAARGFAKRFGQVGRPNQETDTERVGAACGASMGPELPAN
jgi:hypothetical protein